MDELDAEIQTLTALLADEEPRVLQAVEDNRKALATARGTWTRLKKNKNKAKSKAEARQAAEARVLELEVPLRNQEALAEKRKRLIALESEKARRIRAEEVVRGIEHNARVPTFLKLPRNILDDILYEALLSHKLDRWNELRRRKPWEVRIISVCKAMHKHVVASPAMWTFISMAISGSSRAIQTYISRSGCLKLHVSLRVYNDDIESLKGYDPRFALLARNIHRIQVLCISCDGYCALNVATIPFHHLSASSLIRLRLSFDVDEEQLYQQEDLLSIPTKRGDDDDSSEFPLPSRDAKGAASLRAGIVLVAKAPVLSTVSINNGYFARDLPFLAQVKTFCLTHAISYVPDMECDDDVYLGNSDALRRSVQQLVVARDAFGYSHVDQEDEEDDDDEEQEDEEGHRDDGDKDEKEVALHLPSLRSIFLLSPVRGTYDNLYQQPLQRYNILHSISAPNLSNLGFFHEEQANSPDSDEEDDDCYYENEVMYPMSIPNLLRATLRSRQPKFPQLKRLVAIHSGGLQSGGRDEPPTQPVLKVLADTSQALKCKYAPFHDLEELMLVDDVQMGIIEGILGHEDSSDGLEPCRYPKLTGLTLAVHRKPNLEVDLVRLEKLVRARRDTGVPLKSLRFVGHALPETEEEEAESQKICQRMRDLGVEDVRMHHGSAMLYLFLEKMFGEELVGHLKGLPSL